MINLSRCVFPIKVCVDLIIEISSMNKPMLNHWFCFLGSQNTVLFTSILFYSDQITAFSFWIRIGIYIIYISIIVLNIGGKRTWHISVALRLPVFVALMIMQTIWFIAQRNGCICFSIMIINIAIVKEILPLAIRLNRFCYIIWSIMVRILAVSFKMIFCAIVPICRTCYA